MQMSEVPETIPSLWPTVQQWLASNPQHLAPGSLLPAFLDGPIDDGAPAFALPFVGRQHQQGQPAGRRSSGLASGGSGSSSGREGGSSSSSSSSSSSEGGKAPNVPAPYLERGYTGCHFW